MDTRSKKYRPFLAWLCFFLGMNIIILYGIGAAAGWREINDNFDEIVMYLKGDFKEMQQFKDRIGLIFTRLAESTAMDEKSEEAFVGKHSMAEAEGSNLIYYSKNLATGKTFTNTDMEVNDGFAEGKGVLPKGYDFYLYFNGEKLLMQKGGRVIDLYSYNNGYWNKLGSYLSGFESSNNRQLENVRILLVVKKKIEYNPYSYSFLFEANQEFRKYRIIVYGALAGFFAGVALLAASVIKRRSKRIFVEKLAAFTGWFWIEIKVLLSVILWILCIVMIREPIYSAFYIIIRVLAILALFWWFYLTAVDLLNNKKKVFCNNIINSLIILYKKLESRMLFQKYMLYRMFLLIAAETVQIFFIMLFILSKNHRLNHFTLMSVVLSMACFYLIYRYMRKFINTVNEIGNIFKQISAVRNGDITPCHLLSPASELYQVQEELNLIQEGISRAIEEKTKSERMKMELVTNVSHDLKTPLTSIISYVDLLAKETGLPAHVMEYVNILSQKAERLKVLIQDLFELSKASSGDIMLNMEKLDLCKLIRQTLADMDEQVAQSGLVMKVNIPEDPVFISSDGTKLYRVFQNLYSNALKYSLAGSRVYTDLFIRDHEVVVTIKNTSAYEMNFSEDEIMERFVRGDQARSTEGSGLGLAIARSFVQVCGGNMEIKVDGDLFKVILTFKGMKDMGGVPLSLPNEADNDTGTVPLTFPKETDEDTEAVSLAFPKDGDDDTDADSLSMPNGADEDTGSVPIS